MARKKRNGLTDVESCILQILWNEKRPLLRSEILEKLPSQNFNPVSLYGVLNSMVDRKMISVEGKYKKTYQAVFTQEEYAALQLADLTPNLTPASRITGVFSFFLRHEDLDLETVDELEQMLNDYRKGLTTDEH